MQQVEILVLDFGGGYTQLIARSVHKQRFVNKPINKAFK